MSRSKAPPSPNFRGKGSRKSRRSGTAPAAGGGNHPFWILLAGILIGGGGVWFYDHQALFHPMKPPAPQVHAAASPRPLSTPPVDESAPPPTSGPAAPLVPTAPRKSGEHAPPPAPVHHPALDPRTGVPARPRVAIVMDDAGASLQQVESLGRLDTRLTLAVLPFLHDSAGVADYWHGRGREVILHLPMEADDDAAHAAGEGALRPGMSDAEVRDTVQRDVAAVPHISGVNNHMGSRATSDPRLMRVFLEALKPSGLYFLDSRTTGKSVAYATAQELGVRSAMRNGTFLDDERTPAAIHAMLATLLQQARAQGGAVGIGHVTSPETIAVLSRELPGLARDYDFVYASELAR